MAIRSIIAGVLVSLASVAMAAALAADVPPPETAAPSSASAPVPQGGTSQSPPPNASQNASMPFCVSTTNNRRFARLAATYSRLKKYSSGSTLSGLSGNGSRQRVQVSAQDWQRIADIADHVEVGRHKPSPAQVASVLIHLALERIPSSEIDRLMQVERRE